MILEKIKQNFIDDIVIETNIEQLRKKNLEQAA